MLKTFVVASLVGTLVAVIPTTFAAAAPRHHVRIAPRYVPGQIYNYNTLATARRWWPCGCAGWHYRPW
jgi:hypothetical protein